MTATMEETKRSNNTGRRRRQRTSKSIELPQKSFSDSICSDTAMIVDSALDFLAGGRNEGNIDPFELQAAFSPTSNEMLSEHTETTIQSQYDSEPEFAEEIDEELEALDFSTVFDSKFPSQQSTDQFEFSADFEALLPKEDQSASPSADDHGESSIIPSPKIEAFPVDFANFEPELPEPHKETSERRSRRSEHRSSGRDRSERRSHRSSKKHSGGSRSSDRRKEQDNSARRSHTASDHRKHENHSGSHRTRSQDRPRPSAMRKSHSNANLPAHQKTRSQSLGRKTCISTRNHSESGVHASPRRSVGSRRRNSVSLNERVDHLPNRPHLTRARPSERRSRRAVHNEDSIFTLTSPEESSSRQGRRSIGQHAVEDSPRTSAGGTNRSLRGGRRRLSLLCNENLHQPSLLETETPPSGLIHRSLPTSSSTSELPSSTFVSASGEIATISSRPTLQRSGPSARQTNPKFEGLLQKLRDPSCRNLGSLVVDDEDKQDGTDKPKGNTLDSKVSKRNLFARLKPTSQSLKHTSIGEE